MARFLGALLAVAGGLIADGGWTSAAAFVCQTYDGQNCIRWLEAETTIRPFLGAPFDPSVFFAAALWTDAGAGFRFHVVSGGRFNDPCTTPGPCQGTGAIGDNPVFFASNVCGRSFGNDVLAQTINCYRLDDGGIVNSPVFFNRQINWAVYDGPLISGATDIRRVILHELGHVAGLNHPDDAGQNVIAVMNSRVSSIDRLQADDIGGLRFIYAGGPPPGGGGGASGGCTLVPAGGAGLPLVWWVMGLLLSYRVRSRAGVLLPRFPPFSRRRERRSPLRSGWGDNRPRAAPRRVTAGASLPRSSGGFSGGCIAPAVDSGWG